jgi:hypothetical protein
VDEAETDVMRLLGHRDYHMTMRYAAITPENVGDEYAKALTQLASKYRLSARSLNHDVEPDPDHLLEHLARWLRKHLSQHRRLKAFLQRIERLRCEVQRLRTPLKHKP